MAAVQKMAFGLKIRLDIYINSTRVRNMSSSTIVVETKSGSYRGYTKKSTGGRGFFSFRGIPYAQAPIGKLRFQMPQPVMPHLDVLDACKCGPDCPQFNLFTRQVTGSEDNCLSLNIYSPISTSLDSRKRPVVIWVHGGGFSFGSGSDFIYGPNYAMDQDIVFVTINYRLSIFGFCNGIKGIPPNLGLHDQRLAIQWIKDNIINFGGDMSNITLMGESAGAASVHSHSLSDHNHLFQKMILQAGTPYVSPNRKFKPRR